MSRQSPPVLMLLLLHAFLLYLPCSPSSAVVVVATPPPRPQWHALPNETLFPGPWEDYISAPVNKSHIRPRALFRVAGEVVAPEAILTGGDDLTRDREGGKIGGRPKEDLKKRQLATSGLRLGRGGLVTVEFDQNIAGRVCIDVSHVKHDAFVSLAYSESPIYADRQGDTTTERQERDLPLLFPILHTGINCVAPEFLRGGFKYLTIYMPTSIEDAEGFWHDGGPPKGWKPYPRSADRSPGKQKLLNMGKEPELTIANLWVNCTAFPSNPNPRAYTGYFHSSSETLNRIWYAGAYTLQLSTIDPHEGSAIIDLNRNWNHNQSPQGSWYSNFSIARGTSVTTDGAKRDRMVWPGDMSIAIPGIALTTYDLVSVRNALEVLFEHQYPDGSLPYAGPPMGRGREFSDTYHLHALLGVYNYILYSGDTDFLYSHWSSYVQALQVSISKVDEYDLLHVTSGADWLRPGMTGHNLEASALLHEVLQKSILLAEFLGDYRFEAQMGGLWERTIIRLRRGIEQLWCPREGLFADNIGRRGCGGPEQTLPQDGNSWALLTGLLSERDPRKDVVSQSLRKRWVKHGAPAVEYPNVISPFVSSFELAAHGAASNVDYSVELMLREWGHLLNGKGFTNSTLAEGFRIDGDSSYPAYWSAARNSHAHGWSTGPTSSLVSDVLGIHLTEPLGRTWEIKPDLTRWLSHAQGGFATRLGVFEVKVKRMRSIRTNEPAELLEIVTPTGTKGTVHWGLHKARMSGGGRKLFARWLHADQRKWIELSGFTRFDTVTAEELDTARREWATAREGILGLVPDASWTPPSLEHRPVGVVDWKALKEGYVDKAFQPRDRSFPGIGVMDRVWGSVSTRVGQGMGFETTPTW